MVVCDAGGESAPGVITMRANDFRRIASGMKGAVEGAHMGHPDFRVNNRIFATLHHDPEFGMVKLTPDQQEQFMRAHPDAFAPESGAWGRAGCTRVRLAVGSRRNAGRSGDARLAEHCERRCVNTDTQIGETDSAVEETLSVAPV